VLSVARRPKKRPGSHVCSTAATVRFSGRTYPQLARIVRELCAVAGRCCLPVVAAVAVIVAVTPTAARAPSSSDPSALFSFSALLAEHAWDWTAALAALQRFVLAHLGDAEAVVVLDEIAELKKGDRTVGVGRQHAGITGQVDYCRPLKTFKSSFRATIGLYFFKERFA
jgi:hypothetical protein